MPKFIGNLEHKNLVQLPPRTPSLPIAVAPGFSRSMFHLGQKLPIVSAFPARLYKGIVDRQPRNALWEGNGVASGKLFESKIYDWLRELAKLREVFVADPATAGLLAGGTFLQPMNAAVRRYLKDIAAKGGKAGTGKVKVRGGASYYKRISAMAAKARKAKAAQRRAKQ